MEHKFDVSIIATQFGSDEHTVIQFNATGRDAKTLIYGYCSGIQAALNVTIIVDSRHYSATAGHYVKNINAVANHLFLGDS